MDYNYEDLNPIKKGDDVESKILPKLIFYWIFTKTEISLPKLITKFSLPKTMLPIFMYPNWIYYRFILSYFKVNYMFHYSLILFLRVTYSFVPLRTIHGEYFLE
jgi:hypothetical protein